MNDQDQRTEQQDPRNPEAAPGMSDELTELRRQRDDYLDQLQRARADFLNYQKRAKSQSDAELRYAAAPLALDLLSVIDNLERATEAARSAGASSIVEGLEMVQKQFLGALAKNSVEPIAALGQPFDPNQHEALVQQPDAKHPEGTVVAELGRGYRLHDRVLRPTKVAVSIPPADR